MIEELKKTCFEISFCFITEYLGGYAPVEGCFALHLVYPLSHTSALVLMVHLLAIGIWLRVGVDFGATTGTSDEWVVIAMRSRLTSSCV